MDYGHAIGLGLCVLGVLSDQFSNCRRVFRLRCIDETSIHFVQRVSRYAIRGQIQQRKRHQAPTSVCFLRAFVLCHTWTGVTLNDRNQIMFSMIRQLGITLVNFHQSLTGT